MVYVAGRGCGCCRAECLDQGARTLGSTIHAVYKAVGVAGYSVYILGDMVCTAYLVFDWASKLKSTSFLP